MHSLKSLKWLKKLLNPQETIDLTQPPPKLKGNTADETHSTTVNTRTSANKLDAAKRLKTAQGGGSANREHQ
jgi:hypothetical protein